MKQTQTIVTFEIRIKENTNSTWQGELLIEGQIKPFKSELELLQAVNHLFHERENSVWQSVNAKGGNQHGNDCESH